MAWTNHTSVCRLCLQQDGFLLGIFNNHANTNTSIQKKITECTTLKPNINDGLPPFICHRCLYKLELCVEFKEQCLFADVTLRQVKSQKARGEEAAGSDQDVDIPYQSTTVPIDAFEQFTAENQKMIPEEENVDDVVMVCNPEVDYDSDASEEMQSEHDNVELNDSELKNVFMCKFCDRAYTEKEKCRAHETMEHNLDVPFMCSQCDMTFGDRTNYTAHLKSIHQNDKPFGCPQCPRSFSRRSDLRKHTIVHTGIKPFTCHVCYKSFSRNTNLTKHLRIHSGDKPFVCPQCPKTFISKGDLTRHALIHSGQKPFICNYCNQSFGRRDKLIRHEKRHFPNGGEERTSISELELLRQQIAFSGYNYEGPVKEETKEEPPEPENYENLVINVDPFNKDEEPRIRIPAPDNSDDDLNEYDSLKRQIETVKKYPCFVCHKRFSSAVSLRFHSTIHSSTKQFNCTECSKSFLRKRELDRHLTVHTGMKPFKCTSCEKSFGRKDKLVRHMRIHETNVCNLCGMEFGRKDVLMNHMKTHSVKVEVAD